MTKIILGGCCGKMGTAVTNAASQRDDVEIVCGVDIYDNGLRDYPVYKTFEEIKENGDVIIDFSNPSLLQSILDYSKKEKVPAILCATGYSESQVDEIEQTSKSVAMFRSGNMSLGINLISELATAAAKVLGSDFDVEIVEAHHNQKVDAPSGTAIMLENAVADGLSYEPETVYDRHDKREKRKKNEIGMHSIRGGTIVGEHEVIFAGNDEIVKISHTALSKNIFAIGALNAAVFMKDKTNGLFNMNDCIKAIN